MEKHRPFRLTRSAVEDGTVSASLGFALVQQLVILLMAGMILDGGRVFEAFCYAALAYWVCVAIILLRRRRCLTAVDKIVIRIGFLFVCAISVALTSFIWHLKGV